ncbi:hypothetical protein DFH09DRAFT_1206957 [Mycena vulgaris]|nr:hypothetical protein DFH09DRAFT_1206957 [Mycena vulgaris]
MRKIADTETYFLAAFSEALDQLAEYFAEKGDSECATAAMSESTEVREKMALLPPEPEFLFEEIDIQSDSENEDEEDAEAWDTPELEEYYHATTDTKAVSASTTNFQGVEAQIQPRTSEDEDRIASPEPVPQARTPSVDDAATSPIAAKRSAETIKPRHIRIADILSTPLEVRLSSTLMDLLWWILLGILSFLVAVLSVALVFIWNRV